MRRDVRTALVLAAGVGTALGAGAGLASADTSLPQLPTLPSAPQIGSSSSSGDNVGSLPTAPNLALGEGTSRTRTDGSAADAAPVSGDMLANLPTSGQLSGLGQGGGLGG